MDIIASVSGGETSIFMAKRLKDEGHNVTCIFSNTGLENNETLDCLQEADSRFGLNLIWVEAVTNQQKGKGITHRVTNYENAYRFHQYKDINHPFHAHIRKNGIPNRVFKQCSDRLKEFAIEHYKKTHGLKGLPHAIGIRMDESRRATPKDVQDMLRLIDVEPIHYRNAGLKRFEYAETNPKFHFLTKAQIKRLKAYTNKLNKYNLIYPLCDMFPSDKIDVSDFWEDQDFRLELEAHQGNCRTCWKKSNSKLALIAKETPEWFDAFKWYEQEYSFVKPTDDGKPRLFFRGNRSAEMIIGESALLDAYDLRKIIGAERESEHEGCAESCNGYSVI